jgi:uncharacterized RDD family membrane protein YckC
MQKNLPINTSTHLPTFPMQFASLWRRLSAFIIDTLLLVAVLWVVHAAFLGDASTAFSNVFDEADDIATDEISLFGWLLNIIVPACYYIICHASIKQATFGKQWMGIYVIKANGGKIHFTRATWRYAIFFTPQLIVIAIMILPGMAVDVIGNFAVLQILVVSIFSIFNSLLWILEMALYALLVAPIIFTPQKTAIHDMIAGTRVVVGKPVTSIK